MVFFKKSKEADVNRRMVTFVREMEVCGVRKKIGVG
jgi:hypothetical protein